MTSKWGGAPKPPKYKPKHKKTAKPKPVKR